MSIQEAEGVRLLTDDAAAREAGVDAETIWGWEARGLISPVETPCGPRYPLHEIRAVLSGEALPKPRRLTTAYRAAELLGCGPSNLRKLVRAGLLHRDGLGRYEIGELEALRDKRAAAKAD